MQTRRGSSRDARRLLHKTWIANREIPSRSRVLPHTVSWLLPMFFLGATIVERQGLQFSLLTHFESPFVVHRGEDDWEETKTKKKSRTTAAVIVFTGSDFFFFSPQSPNFGCKLTVIRRFARYFFSSLLLFNFNKNSLSSIFFCFSRSAAR